MSDRNGFIDFWKFFFAIGVILVHIPLPGVYGNIGTAVGVCGVGFFYLISGYACYGPDKKEMCSKILKRFWRNGIITLITIIIYLVFAYFEKKNPHWSTLPKIFLIRRMMAVALAHMTERYAKRSDQAAKNP